MADPIRVACIDDDEDLWPVLQLVLSDVGDLDVTFYDSGEDAIAHLATATPDIILIDCVMPGRDGPDTLEILRRYPILKQVPALFVTGHHPGPSWQTCKKLGADGVFLKPLDPAILLARIFQLIDESDVS